MILFVDAHRSDYEGRFRFQRYVDSIRRYLKRTVYFGNEVNELVKRSDYLNDFIFDGSSFRCDELARKRFYLLEYIFIDGCASIPPWSYKMSDVVLFIRLALHSNKRMHCNGFAHFATYYELSTKFDTPVCIHRQNNKLSTDRNTSRKTVSQLKNKYTTQNINEIIEVEANVQPIEVNIQTSKQLSTFSKQFDHTINRDSFKEEINQYAAMSQYDQLLRGKLIDYEYEPETGNLSMKGKLICNSGITLSQNNRHFTEKSSQALTRGIVLSSKFDYIAFDANSNHKLLENISLPFIFFWKGRMFCIPKAITHAKVDIIIYTDKSHPLAFTTGSIICTQGLCSEMIQLIHNWLVLHTYGTIDRKDLFHQLQYKSTLDVLHEFKTTKIATKRLESAKLRALQPKGENSSQQLRGNNIPYRRSRMHFKGKLYDLYIGNYVQRTPSRPASSHKFRDIDKSKWLNKYPFFS